MKRLLAILALLASPVFAATPSDQATAPDNTNRNATNQPTAENQSEGTGDREITRNIRRTLVKSDSLSEMAKNVKVITSGGNVTLRGPVHSEQEKMKVDSIAEKIAGKGKVSNRLEVKKSQ